MAPMAMRADIVGTKKRGIVMMSLLIINSEVALFSVEKPNRPMTSDGVGSVLTNLN